MMMFPEVQSIMNVTYTVGSGIKNEKVSSDKDERVHESTEKENDVRQ